MKSTLSKIAAMSTIAIAMLFTSCGKKDTADSLTDEFIAQSEALATAMGEIKDKESAESVAKKIDTIADEMSSIAERLSKLPDPTEDEKKKLKEKMDKAHKEMEGKMIKIMADVPKEPEIMTIIGTAMANLSKKMEPHTATFEKFGQEGR